MATALPSHRQGPHRFFAINFLSLIFVSAGAALAEASLASLANVAQSSGRVKLPKLQDLRFALSRLVSFSRESIAQKYQQAIHGQLGLWDMMQLATLCGLGLGVGLWRNRSSAHDAKPEIRKPGQGGRACCDVASQPLETVSPKSDAEVADPGLLRRHSTYKSYITSSATYPSIRTFYRPHSQADKLPSEPTPLPLLVFIHGLGGSLAQFHPLLSSLINVGPCLGIDLPGCGRSEFSPRSWAAYTTNALAELLSLVIKEHCDHQAGQGVVLVGHSMGCSLSALIASSTLTVPTDRRFDVLALIAICPKATPPSEQQISIYRMLLSVPTPIFDLFRMWDRRGGPYSGSVARFVGRDADIKVKKLQERFNRQSQTGVWRRMALGALPKRGASKASRSGLPGLDIWAKLKIPYFLVGGEGDGITGVDEITKISRALGKLDEPRNGDSSSSQAPLEKDPQVISETSNEIIHQPSRDEKPPPSRSSNTETTIIRERSIAPNGQPQRRQVLKTSILPSPASHALLYDSATSRILAGLIHAFLHDHVDFRLSLGWQLQYLSTEGKWDVKNLAKWQKVVPVSEPIAGIFRAMKTLREVDDTHSPSIFVSNWSGKLKAVIDISHESPVYDPKGLDEGGIEYHKFPTVSKIPPTAEECKDFINLVDRLRSQPPITDGEEALIGVHCHYGFNRTGFFICSYLIEKEGFGVQKAIDLFAEKRPPGIRHAHFLDMLCVQYCVGLKRIPTQ